MIAVVGASACSEFEIVCAYKWPGKGVVDVVSGCNAGGGVEGQKKGANLSTKETFLVPRNRNEVCWSHYLSKGVQLTRERVVVQTAARDAGAERVVRDRRLSV